MELAKVEMAISNEAHETDCEITPDLVKAFFNYSLTKDITDNDTKIAIIRHLIRYIVVYNEKIVILFNSPGTKPPKSTKLSKEELKEINRQSDEKSAAIIFRKSEFCALAASNLPPMVNYTNPKNASWLLTKNILGKRIIITRK